jgi:hypothetical protein
LPNEVPIQWNHFTIYHNFLSFHFPSNSRITMRILSQKQKHWNV